jgi:hypothetical protein
MKRVIVTARWLPLLAWCAVVLSCPPRSAARRFTAEAARPKTPAGPAAASRITKGRVVGVCRGSREIAIQTPRGTIERIAVPATALVHTTRGARSLDDLHAGMVVRAEIGADSTRGMVAHTVEER